MNNNVSFKTNKDNKTPIITEIKDTKPPRVYFNDLAKENNEKYQELRRDNKTLANLNKIYNKTKKRNEELKQNLINNPCFKEDYERILTAYKAKQKIDPDTLNILSLFNFEEI